MEELGRYETSEKLLEIGVVSGYDMTFEAAITKTMFLLGQDLRKDEIICLLQKPLRGELTLPESTNSKAIHNYWTNSPLS
jgi:L-asparaginase